MVFHNYYTDAETDKQAQLHMQRHTRINNPHNKNVMFGRVHHSALLQRIVISIYHKINIGTNSAYVHMTDVIIEIENEDD